MSERDVVIKVRADTRQAKAGLSGVEQDLKRLERLTTRSIRDATSRISGLDTPIPGAQPAPYYSANAQRGGAGYPNASALRYQLEQRQRQEDNVIQALNRRYYSQVRQNVLSKDPRYAAFFGTGFKPEPYNYSARRISGALAARQQDDFAARKKMADSITASVTTLQFENKILAQSIGLKRTAAQHERELALARLKARGATEEEIASLRKEMTLQSSLKNIFGGGAGGRGGGGTAGEGGGFFSGIVQGLWSLRKAFLGALAVYYSFRAAFSGVETYKNFLEKLIEIQSRLEKVRFGIAQVSLVSGKFLEIGSDKPLPFGEQFALGLERAKIVTDQLLDDSIKFGLNYARTVQIFPALIGPALRLHATLSDTVELTRNMAIFGDKIGLSQNQLVRTIDNILKGFRVENTELGSALGLTNAQVKAWKDQGVLVQKLKELLGGINQSLGDNLNTYQGQINSIQALLTAIGQDTTDILFQSAKGLLSDVRDLLDSIRNDDADMRGIADAVNAGFTTMLEALDYLVNHASDIKAVFADITEWYQHPVQAALKAGAKGALRAMMIPGAYDFLTGAQSQVQQSLTPQSHLAATIGERLRAYRTYTTPIDTSIRGAGILQYAQRDIKEAKTYQQALKVRDYYLSVANASDLDPQTRRSVTGAVRTAYVERFQSKNILPPEADKEAGKLRDAQEKFADELLKLLDTIHTFNQKAQFDFALAQNQRQATILGGRLDLNAARASTAEFFGRPSAIYGLTDQRQAIERQQLQLQVEANSMQIGKVRSDIFDLYQYRIPYIQSHLDQQSTALASAGSPLDREKARTELTKTTEEQVQNYTKILDMNNELVGLDGQRLELQAKQQALLERQTQEIRQQREVYFDLGKEISQTIQNSLFGSGSLKQNLEQLGRSIVQSYVGPALDTIFQEVIGKSDTGINLGGLTTAIDSFFGIKPQDNQAEQFAPFVEGSVIFDNAVTNFVNAVASFESNAGVSTAATGPNASGFSRDANGNVIFTDTGQALSTVARTVGGKAGGGIGQTIGTIQNYLSTGKTLVSAYQAYQGAGGGFAGIKAAASNYLGLSQAAAPAAAGAAPAAGSTFANVAAGGSSTAAAGAASGGAGGAAAGLGGAAGAAGYLAAAIALLGSITAQVDAARIARKSTFATASTITQAQNQAIASGGFNAVGLKFLGNALGKVAAKLPTRTAAQRVVSGAATGTFYGLEGQIINAIIQGTTRPPTPGALQARLLAPILRDIGLPKDVRFGPGKFGVYTSLRPGGTRSRPGGLPSAYDEILSQFSGLGEAGRQSLRTGIANSGIRGLGEAIQAAILGTAADLGLGSEDALGLGREFVKKSTGSLEAGGIKLLKARRQRSGLRITQSQLAGALGSLVAAYGDLALSIDTAALGQAAFVKGGLVSFKALQRAAEDASSVIGGVGSAFKAATESGNVQDAAQSMADNFAQTFVNRIAERLSSTGAFGKALTEATVAADQAAAALAAGDTAGAQRYLTQARISFLSGQQGVNRTTGNILPTVLGFLSSIGVFQNGGLVNQTGAGIPSFDTQTMKVVPGALGSPQLAVVHGGEPIYNPKYHDMVMELRRARSAPPNVHVYVQVDGKDVAKNVRVRFENPSGIKLPDPSIGIVG